MLGSCSSDSSFQVDSSKSFTWVIKKASPSRFSAPGESPAFSSEAFGQS
uniref:Uncharacterized protein n=1 Tax=Anguilla anguilla TaxID=7936 RepID=A0A0E9QA54_ANGAN